MRRVGYGPSRKNPSMCVTCFEKAPMGGAQMEIGVLFADLRGFTGISESMAPEAVAEMLNGFYGSATKVLSRCAIIDKMVGDQVMALYLPPLLSEHWENEMLRDARELLARPASASPPRPRCSLASVSTSARLSLATWAPASQGFHRARGCCQYRRPPAVVRAGRPDRDHPTPV